MDRKSFFQKACGLGMCSCVFPSLLHGNELSAKEGGTGSWKEGFVQHRFSKLIDILDETLDEETKNGILENLGRECSKRSQIEQYKDNLEGFWEHIKNDLGETATFDKETGVIRVETAERECFCLMFDSRIVSQSICQCSVGWQSQTYETVLGQSVETKCVESVIRGSTRCVFEIRLSK